MKFTGHAKCLIRSFSAAFILRALVTKQDNVAKYC